MIWFMATRFENIVLPDEVNDSKAGRCLQKVMQHISLHEYDVARQLWCQGVLGSPYTNPVGNRTHSLFGTTFALFQDLLPGIFMLSKDETTRCSSPYCPRPEQTHRHRFNEFDNGSSEPISQDTFDRAMFHKDAKAVCSEEFNDATVEGIDWGLCRTDSRFNDDGIPEPFLACRGRRTYINIKIRQLPTVMIVTNVNRQAIEKFEAPCTTLRLLDHEYHLIGLIFKNSIHFRAIAVVQGKYLWYDGIAAVKSKWIYLSEIDRMMRGYFVAEVWYLRKPSHSPLPSTSTPSSTPLQPGPPSHSSLPSSRSNSFSPPPSCPPSPITSPPSPSPCPISPKDRSLSPPASPFSWPSTPPQQPSPGSESPAKSKRPRYSRAKFPYGFSVQRVSKAGRHTICRGCKQPIDRKVEEERMVWKKRTNPERGWSEQVSFHMDENCYRLGIFAREDLVAVQIAANKYKAR
jgi:hypothetical protein